MNFFVKTLDTVCKIGYNKYTEEDRYTEEKQSKGIMGNREIRELAKRFIAANQYGPPMLYAVIFAYAVLIVAVIFFALVISAVAWFILPLFPLLFLLAPVSYSAAGFFSASQNGEAYSSFIGFKKENFLRSLGLMLLQFGFGLLFFIGFFIGLIVALYYGFGPMVSFGIGLGFLVPFLIPLLIFFSRSAFAVYHLREDSAMRPWSAFRLSFANTKGKSLQLAGLFLSYSGWFLLGIISLGILFIYAVPLFQTAKSIFFRSEIQSLPIDGLPELPRKTPLMKASPHDTESGTENRRETTAPKKKKKSNSLIQDDENFEQQAEDIRNLIHIQEVILPPNIRARNDKDLEIRENETFEEYRIRVQNSRGRVTDNPAISPQEIQRAAEESRLLTQEKEKLKAEAELQLSKSAELSSDNDSPLDEKADMNQAQILEDYFKTDDAVAKIIETQVQQNTTEMQNSMSEPGLEDASAENFEAYNPEETEAKKRAMAEKIAHLKAETLRQTAERMLSSESSVTVDRRTQNDRRAQNLRSKEYAVETQEPVASVRSDDRLVISEERTVISSPRTKSSREEILERIRREREKK